MGRIISVKIGLLKDNQGELSNLVNGTRLVTINGNKEEIGLTHEKLESIRRTDVLIGKGFLDGEKDFLRTRTDLLIDMSPLEELDAEVTRVNVGVSGLCVDASCVEVSHVLPVRDSSFSEVSVVELLDLGVIKEVHRSLRKGGTMRLFMRDKAKGGPDPKKVVGYIEAGKFVVVKVLAHGSYWEFVCRAL